MRRKSDTGRPGRDALIGYSPNGEIVSWNAGASELYGWTAQEAVGQNKHLLVPVDQRVTEDDLWQQVRSGEEGDAPGVKRLHKSGRIMELSIRMSAMLDRSGTTIGFVSCSREDVPAVRNTATIDTSDGPVTVATVRDAVGSGELLRQIAEVTTIGLSVKEIDSSDCLYANPAFFHIFSLDPASPPAVQRSFVADS